MVRLAPTLVAIAASVALLVAAALPLVAPQDEDLAVPSASGAASATASIPNLAEYADDMAARPLFHPTRKPYEAPQEAVEAAPAPQTERLRLIGIIAGDDAQIALLTSSLGGDVARLEVGDRMGDWELLEIGKTSVRVQQGDGDPQNLYLGIE